LQRFHKGDTRVFTTTAARPQLIIGFRLQCDAEAFDACRIAGFVKSHSCDADTRVISTRNQPWEQVELTIRTASGSRIQDTFYLLLVTRLRLHDRSEAL
jgi:hypothetical protein